MKSGTLLLLLFTIQVAVPSFIMAQNCPSDSVIKATVMDGSSLSIEGSSTLHSWTVDATRFSVTFCIPPTWFESPDNWTGEDVARLSVIVPVEGLDGGRNKMNRDLKNALNYDEYKNIRFEWGDIRLTGKTDIGWHAEVEGSVTVAGVTRAVSFDADLSYNEWSQVVAKGRVPLKMTDFDVDPPTALFGVIRTDDEIEIKFEIYFSESGIEVD